jgi:PAS domain S-box-containing protein
MTDQLSQKPATLPANEPERLAALRRYRILDTPPEAAFERITTLAARLFNVPIALISLVDESRAWFKSCLGFDAQEVPRDATLCSFAVLTDKPLIVPDARLDDRFACNPFVQQEPGVRFYAGAPLLSPDGFNLGTLCLLDNQPRSPLNAEQQATLSDLAAMVVDELELRLAAQKVAQVDAALLEITQGVATATGTAFFEALVQQFAKVLGAEYAYIGLIEGAEPQMIRTIATCAHGQLVDDLEYPLRDTPCWEVIQQGKICCYPRDVQAHFPNAPLLKPLAVESYIAIPFFDSSGRSVGLLGVMDGKPLEQVQLAESLLSIFAVRIATELERQQAEAALRSRESQLQTLFDGVPLGVFLVDQDFRLRQVNPIALPVFSGIPDVIGRDFDEVTRIIWPPPFAEEVLERFRHTLTTGEPYFVPELIQQRQDRAIVEYYEWQINRVPLPKEQYGVVCYFRDISTQVLARQTIAASEERLRSFVEADVIGILFGDVYGGIHEANNELLRIVGYTRSDLETGRLRWIDITPAEYLPLDEQRIAEAQARGACTPYEKEYIRKDGSRVPVLIGYSLVGEAREESVVFILDLSDRKQAEAALRESEARFRHLADTAPMLVWMSGPDKRCNYFNHSWLKFTGRTIDQELGNGWVQGVHPEDFQRCLDTYTTAFDARLSFEMDYRLKRFDGEYRWIVDTGIPRFTSEGKFLGYIGSCFDIHERKQLEAEKDRILQLEQAAREKAEQANQIKDEFLAVLSHELRSPLNPILGWSKLLLSDKLDAAQTQQALRTIERNARLQSELIEDLLDVSRILQGKLSLNISPVNLNGVIQAAIETVSLAAEAKAVTVTARLNLVGEVLGDSTRLQQVVWNLLSNAVKFTPTGGRVEVQLEEIEHQAQITVRDTGRGIASTFLPHVFDYFRQADSTTTRTFGGLGLGLAIVRHLIELHGGTVSAESEGEGLGATFMVRLPLLGQPGVERQEEPPLSQCSTPAAPLAGVQILVVDDAEDSREFIAFVLEQAGAQVKTAASAAEAFSVLTRTKFDVLLSDIGMPEMDGYALMRQVRALLPEQGGQVKAIALTAYAGDFNQQQAFQAGFQRHLAKPIEPQALVQAIAQLILN